MTRVHRVAGGILAAAAAYTAVAVGRYLLADAPRYQAESAWFVFAGLGVLAVLLRGGSGQTSGHSAQLPSGEPWLPASPLFAAIALMLYAPALGVGLLSDDYVIAGWARRLELMHLEETGFVRPGVPLFWAALDRLPGSLAAAVHAANIVLHGVNASLTALIASRFGLTSGEALAAGALFLLFPGLSEAVVWGSGVQDVLMTTLAMGAVALATARPPRVGAATVAAAAALSVKETAIVVPVLAALVLVGRGGLTEVWRGRAALGALALCSAVYAAARVAAGLPSSLLVPGDWRYFAKQLVANAFAGLGAPWTAAWMDAHPLAAFARCALLVGAAAAAFAVWRRGDPGFRRAAAAAAWVLAAVLPALSLFYVGPHLEGSRYLYLPAAGFSLLAVVILGSAAGARPGARLIVVAAGVAALTLPYLPAIRADIGRWQAAAAVRDEVIAALRDRGSACTSFVAEGAADSVAGAYVFRHGLAEALAVGGSGAGNSCRVLFEAGEPVLRPAR